MKFYDREEEMEILQQNDAQAETSAVFTVMMGRRRVGKTSLILHALEGKPHAYLFVSRDSEAILCRKFQESLQQQLGIEVYGTLTSFRSLFEVILQESTRRHFTVVLDEFQTLYRINPSIFSEMQDLWDRYHTRSRLHLMVCGSIQSLMRRIFERENEPLYGRPTSKFTLRPFTLRVLRQILADHCPDYKAEDLLCLYMITGGVAKYVELLMDARCYTKDRMLKYVCRPDSYFLTEGRDLVNQEFGDEGNTYFSLLQLIAGGLTRRAEIDGAMGKDMGTFLQNLERNYGMIHRVKPLLARPNSKMTTYEITDSFLRFWFRFICPYQSLVERGQLDLLRRHIEKNYEQFSGRTLEQYFRTLYMESGEYTQVGNWWDRKGENEIDLIALNEFEHTGVVAEVKRNPAKFDRHLLERKVAALPSSDFGKYRLHAIGLSMQDLLLDS